MAQKPENFGIREVFQVEGDAFGMALFYIEEAPRNSAPTCEADAVELALATLANRYWLRSYPWGGALSTAHTLLWIARRGREAFKRENAVVRGAPRLRQGHQLVAPTRVARASFNVAKVADDALRDEAALWHSLVYERRAVSREAYLAAASRVPPASRSPGAFRYAAGRAPEAVRTLPPQLGRKKAVQRHLVRSDEEGAPVASALDGEDNVACLEEGPDVLPHGDT